MDALSGKKVTTTEYKLVRKEVYISLANLSAAFQRMLSEPRSKQKNKNEIHQFTVLNHTLFSNLAAIASSVLSRNSYKYSEGTIRTARKASHNLLASLEKIGEPIDKQLFDSTTEQYPVGEIKDDLALKEQLEFIHKLTTDIRKTIEKIVAA